MPASPSGCGRLMPERPPPPRRRPTAAGSSWVRSLHCKSMAADDVASRGGAAAPKKLHPLLPRAGCGSSGDALTHVASCKPAARPRPKQPGSKPTPEPGKKTTKPKPTSLLPPSPPPGPFGPVPALTELPAGHSSRQVVEIIFLSSWSPLPTPVAQSPPQPGAPTTSSSSAFPGVVEMLFRVHNPARAVARFEDYRAAVRARAGAGAARSAADGNEMMRFSPAPPYDSSHSAFASAAAGGGGGGDDGPRIRTFDGSGGAHASARWPAPGRRAMFLCRVIAGRVAEEAGTTGSEPKPKEHFDSVRVGKGGGGELVVFDRRAVLPCFLIIYRL